MTQHSIIVLELLTESHDHPSPAGAAVNDLRDVLLNAAKLQDTFADEDHVISRAPQMILSLSNQYFNL